jgi:hypothetical protein
MKKVFVLIVCMTVFGTALFAQTTEGEWFDKAGEYFESGDYAKAITAYSETIKRNSSNLDAYWFRGFAYYQTKNYDAAIADYTTVIKGAPDFPNVYVTRGDAYGAKGLYHTAVADYRIGLEKGYDPSSYNVDKSSKADMWFCGAMYMEIEVNRFLGNSAEVTKYENWLETVCDKNNVTRAEVETFYRQNIGALVAETVDAEFNNTRQPSSEIQAVKDILTAFFVRPNTVTFNAVRDVSFIYTITGTALSGEKRKAYEYVTEVYDNTLRSLSPGLIGSVTMDIYSDGGFKVKSGTNDITALARMVQQSAR